jgi:hypothetical protein
LANDGNDNFIPVGVALKEEYDPWTNEYIPNKV